MPVKAPTGSGGGAGASPAPEAPERFDDILGRLRGLVEKLEGGNLSLEDSLRFFEEGVALCKRGQSILDSAEKKVEVLLATGDGGPRTAPIDPDARDDEP